MTRPHPALASQLPRSVTITTPVPRRLLFRRPSRRTSRGIDAHHEFRVCEPQHHHHCQYRHQLINAIFTVSCWRRVHDKCYVGVRKRKLSSFSCPPNLVSSLTGNKFYTQPTFLLKKDPINPMSFSKYPCSNLCPLDCKKDTVVQCWGCFTRHHQCVVQW